MDAIELIAGLYDEGEVLNEANVDLGLMNANANANPEEDGEVLNILNPVAVAKGSLILIKEMYADDEEEEDDDDEDDEPPPQVIEEDAIEVPLADQPEVVVLVPELENEPEVVPEIGDGGDGEVLIEVGPPSIFKGPGPKILSV